MSALTKRRDITLVPKPGLSVTGNTKCPYCEKKIPKGDPVLVVPTYDWSVRHSGKRCAHYECYNEKVAKVALKEYEKQARAMKVEEVIHDASS